MGCVIPIVILSEIHIGQYRDDDYREGELHLKKTFLDFPINVISLLHLHFRFPQIVSLLISNVSPLRLFKVISEPQSGVFDLGSLSTVVNAYVISVPVKEMSWNQWSFLFKSMRASFPIRIEFAWKSNSGRRSSPRSSNAKHFNFKVSFEDSPLLLV